MDEQLNKLFGALGSINDKVVGWLEAFVLSLPNLLVALIVILIFWVLSGWVYRIVLGLFKHTEFNESLEHMMAYTVKVCVIALGVLFALSILNLEKTVFSMLAGVGVLGLALGFAFQDLAANFVAGLMIAVRAPLKIGDVIKIDSTMGTVQDIRLRDSIIRNFSGQNVIIPNKHFMTDRLTNYSSYGQRKIVVSVGVSYDADVDKAKAVILEAMKKIEGILPEPEPAVMVESLGASSVNLEAHVWIKYPGSDFLKLRDQAILDSKKALDKVGIGIPFPIRTLELSETAQKILGQRKQT